jgi:hypothetical protein
MTKNADDHNEKAKDFEASKPAPKQVQSIVDFFRQSPLMGLDLDLERDKSPGRDIDLGFDE